MATKPAVVLVHGAGLFGLEMIPLACRLRGMGYRARIFSYSQYFADLDGNASRLKAFVGRMDDPVIHLVGHSLGGLVAATFVSENPGGRIGRIVNLASPHTGSLFARRIMRIPLGRFLVGKTVAAAQAREIPLSATNEIGAIAGTLNLGLGWLFRLPRPCDGVVSASEVRHGRLKDYLEIRATHAGMLLSKSVARQIDCFLRNGTFDRTSGSDDAMNV